MAALASRGAAAGLASVNRLSAVRRRRGRLQPKQGHANLIGIKNPAVDALIARGHADLTHHFLDLAHQARARIRLRQKSALSRYGLCAKMVTRGQNDPDLGPALANTLREGRSVEPPRHFNIGKDDAHLRVHFKHPQRFVGIACLQNIKAGLLEKIDAHQADEGLILDDEDGAARLSVPVHLPR